MIDSSNPIIAGLSNRIKELINTKADKTNATQSAAGLMSANDKIKLDTLNDIQIITDEENIVDDGIFICVPPNLQCEFTGDEITLGPAENHWLLSNGDVLIDWGDGTTDTVNNPSTSLTHSYTDGLSSHDIIFLGEVTSLGGYCFGGCTGLTSVVIPDSVTSLGYYCFESCSGLTSVVIPDSVTSLGDNCFMDCTALIDYNLYWTGNNIISYDSGTMPDNTDTIFTVPQGEKANYISAGYPSSKLVERSA